MAKDKKIVSGKQPGCRVVKTKDGPQLVIPNKSSRFFVPAEPAHRQKRRRSRSGKKTGDKRF